MGGTYVLLVDVLSERRIEVGALGSLAFDPGTYAYVGSARGPGGFARVERHHELSRDARDVRHWHVDYLLGADGTKIEAVVLFPDEDRECELVATLPGAPVDGFGASDCDCDGHLLAGDAEAIIEAAIRFGGVRLPGVSVGIEISHRDDVPEVDRG